ncbi:MAG: glycosyltransferase [Spirochaetales bacterium]|nr:glycosyltransferase [Spirochaetales bacterium]
MIYTIISPSMDILILPVPFQVMLFLAIPFFIKLFIYLVLSPWYKIKKFLIQKRYPLRYEPKVTIIIPAWNEEVGIINSIDSALKCDYPDFEVLAINDGSTDRTDEMAREYLENYNKRKKIGSPVLRYHYQANGGKASAINRGIMLAEGEIIITIDSDSIIDSAAIGEFVKHFKDPKVMSVAGNIKVGNIKGTLGLIQHLEFVATFCMKKVESFFNGVFVVGGAAAAYRKSVFDEVGFFTTGNITEDIDMSVRIQDAGYKVLYAEKALVITEGATSFSGLVKQRVRWKRGRFETFLNYKKMFFSTQKKHNPFLTWIILPIGLLAELFLFYEVIFIPFILFYSILHLNLIFLLSGMVIGMTIFMSEYFGNYKLNRLVGPFIPIAPILFYFAVYVEFFALVKTLYTMIFKKEVKWQVWKREGVLGGD